MRPFKSFLASEIEDYLQYRKSLGYKTLPARSYLLTFDDYLAKTEADWHSFTPSFFLKMRTGLTMEARGYQRHFFLDSGAFFHFLVGRGYVDHNPLRDIPRIKKNVVVPFVFSPDQIDQLLKSVSITFERPAGVF